MDIPDKNLAETVRMKKNDCLKKIKTELVNEKERAITRIR